MMFFNLYIKVFKLNIQICSFYMEALNSCKAKILFGFCKIQKHFKAGIGMAFQVWDIGL